LSDSPSGDETPRVTALAERVEELRADRAHGASWLARLAVEAMMEVATHDAPSSEVLLDRLLGAGRQLAESRPGVGAVEGAVGRLLATASRESHLPVEELRRLVREEAASLVDSRRRAGASIAIQLQERLRDALVLTHSASATVREALLHTPPARVVCTLSEPLGEGRAFSEELRAAGLPVELVDDRDAAAELEHASLLLLGADTVFLDGTLCNKIGTSRLAEAADELGVPTVVAAEVIKLAPFEGADAPALSSELGQLFDLTPTEHIDLIVTEEGQFRPDEIRALVDRTPFLAEGYRLLRAQGPGA